MILGFYIPAAIALLATVMVVTRANAVHALLYLVVSLMAVAIIFFAVGAPFAAALEVIVYAGAIMVLFIFTVMLLNRGAPELEQERRWIDEAGWAGPVLLALALVVEFGVLLTSGGGFGETGGAVGPVELGEAIFGPYVVIVGLASFLLTAGLIAAYHLGRRARSREELDQEVGSRSRPQEGGERR
jgi:NADH-quinone oxidoreductase subunit J